MDDELMEVTSDLFKREMLLRMTHALEKIAVILKRIDERLDEPFTVEEK